MCALPGIETFQKGELVFKNEFAPREANSLLWDGAKVQK